MLGALTGAAAVHAPDAAPFALELGLGLADPPLDFGRLAGHWAALEPAGALRQDSTRRLARHLATVQRPPGTGDGMNSMVALPLALPVALATFHAPRELLGAAYHAARLTSADEAVTWGAVAIAVAAARFLLDKRDFIPDVLEALAVNSAPPRLLDAIRRVPVLPPEPLGPWLPELADQGTRSVACALWVAYRVHAPHRATAWLASSAAVDGHAAVAAAGLLAARDGPPGVPREWAPDGAMRQRCEALATRLASPARPAGTG